MKMNNSDSNRLFWQSFPFQITLVPKSLKTTRCQKQMPRKRMKKVTAAIQKSCKYQQETAMFVTNWPKTSVQPVNTSFIVVETVKRRTGIRTRKIAKPLQNFPTE